MSRIINKDLKYYLKWSKGKNRIIRIRSHLSHVLAITLVALTIAREILEYFWKGTQAWVAIYLRENIPGGYGDLVLQILSWVWIGFIVLIAIATVAAAVWELSGNKLDVSEQEKRFALGIKTLLAKIEEFKQQLWKVDSIDLVNAKFDEFSDDFLEVTSKVLCGGKTVHAALIFHFPDDEILRLVRSTPGSNYPPPEKMTIHLPSIPEDHKGPAQMSFENDLLALMPKKSRKLGWVMKEKSNNEDYEFAKLINGWFEPPPPADGVFESVMSVPITSYAEEGLKAYHGVLCFTTEKKDYFILRDYTMAFCFASIIAQAKDAARRRAANFGDPKVKEPAN